MEKIAHHQLTHRNAQKTREEFFSTAIFKHNLWNESTFLCVQSMSDVTDLGVITIGVTSLVLINGKYWQSTG